MYKIYRQFPSCSKLLFQSEMILMKIVFYYHANETYYRKKMFELSLASLESESFWNSEIACKWNRFYAD